MDTKTRIAVLISTYNGQAFVEEQVHSILSQAIDPLKIELHVYIRDDGSSDRTRDILAKLADEHPDIIRIQTKAPGNIGVKRSFFVLVQDPEIDADYFFLADQDDIWEPDKITKTLAAFQPEKSSLPLGVYSDLWLADANGHSTGKSMSEQARWPKNLAVDYQYLSFDYRVTGAAFAFNRTAKKLFTQIPNAFIPLVNMHDSFMALILSVCGKLIQIDEPLVLYRQHGDNLIGGLKKKRSLIETLNNKKREEGQLIVDNLLLDAFLKKQHLTIRQDQRAIIDLYVDYFNNVHHAFKRVATSVKIYHIMHHPRKRVSFILIAFFDVIDMIAPYDEIKAALA